MDTESNNQPPSERFRIFHSESTKRVSVNKKVNITENRAPTDDSIRLLDEFQKEARKHLILSKKLESNFINGIVFVYRDEIIDARIHINVRFKLNENDVLIEFHLDHYDLQREFEKNLFKSIEPFVYKRLSEEITAHISKHNRISV